MSSGISDFTPVLIAMPLLRESSPVKFDSLARLEWETQIAYW